jgi:L-rhamnose isomerase
LEIHETDWHKNTQALFAQMDQQLERQMHDVDDMFSFVLKCNQPTSRSHRATPHPLTQLERLREIADQEYRSFDGMRPYLTRPEVQALSTAEGSLTQEERRQIQQHVAHTFEFLSKIPWAKSLKNVPSIAWSHHESWTGAGTHVV